MTYADYIKSVSFRFCKPHMRPRGYGKLARCLRTSPSTLEIINTRLPSDARGMRERLGGLCQIPRMSTFAIGAMINKAVSVMPIDTSFVNIGVWNGFTFLAGLSGNADKHCVGVDNFSEFGGPRNEFLERFETYKGAKHFFYDMDYSDYFKTVHKGRIGVYIYDGSHAYEDQLKGLQLAEPFFSDACLVFVDDTNWEAPRRATLDFIEQSAHEYEILLDKTTIKNGHPTWWNGLMIFHRIS